MFDQVKLENSNLQAKVRDLEEERTAAAETERVKLEGAAAEANQLRAQLEAARQQIQQCQQELEALRASRQDLDRECQSLRTQLTNMDFAKQNEAQTHHVQLSALQEQVAELQQKLDLVRREKSKIEQQCQLQLSALEADKTSAMTVWQRAPRLWGGCLHFAPSDHRLGAGPVHAKDD